MTGEEIESPPGEGFGAENRNFSLESFEVEAEIED